MAKKATELPRAMREMRTTKAKAMMQARTGMFRREETYGSSRQWIRAYLIGAEVLTLAIWALKGRPPSRAKA